MYYLLCCAGEPLKDFLEWTVGSCFLSSAIAHLRVSSRALLISALKSIENCQSGEISFAVRGPSEWAWVCQTVCGMLLIRVEATPSGRCGRKLKATLCSDVPTLEWRLMLQNRLPVTSTLRLKQRSLLALCAGLHRIGRQPAKNVSRPGVLLSSSQVDEPITRLLSVVVWDVFVMLLESYESEWIQNLEWLRGLMVASYPFNKK